MVNRYGGEEFVVILPATPARGASVVAERIQERVGSLKLTSDKGRAVPVTISVGQATHGDGWRSRDLAELLAAADGALYAAKQHGSNRCAVHAANT